jgi:hypothetical protein
MTAGIVVPSYVAMPVLILWTVAWFLGGLTVGRRERGDD